MAIIKDAQTRLARAVEKSDIVRTFLEHEPFITREHVAELLGLKYPNHAGTLLKRMEKRGELRRHTVPVVGGYKTLWFIGERCEVGAISHLQHLLDIQLMRIRFGTVLQWTDWHQPGHGKVQEDDAFPDAMVKDKAGDIWLIEVERTPKLDYQRTLFSRVQMLPEQGGSLDWSHILFLCPKRRVANIVRERIDKALTLRRTTHKQQKYSWPEGLSEAISVRTYDGFAIGMSLGTQSIPSVVPKIVHGVLGTGNGNEQVVTGG